MAGDFWTNLNKGIDQIVPFALKKQDLENDRARVAASMAHIDKQNAMIDEQIGELRRNRENENALRVKMQELIGKGVPGKETVSVQDLIPGATGDVDRGFSTTGIAPTRTEERSVMRKPTAEELVMGTLPYADPAHALTALAGLSKSEEQQKNLMARVEMQLQNARDLSDAKLRMAEAIARLGADSRRDVALIRASKGSDDKIIDDKRLADWIATVTEGGKEPSDIDVQLIRKAASKLGYDFKKTPGTKYHRAIGDWKIPGTESEEGGGWSLVDAMGSGGADATPPPGFVDSGRTSGGKRVYVKGDQAWVAP